MMTDKRCPYCDEWLDYSMFGKDSHKPDGRRVYCLECNRIREQERYATKLRHRTHAEFIIAQYAYKVKYCPNYNGRPEYNKGALFIKREITLGCKPKYESFPAGIIFEELKTGKSIIIQRCDDKLELQDYMG